MIQALKLKQMVEEDWYHIETLFKNKKAKSQTEITMYFHKVTLSVSASPAFPSSSSTSSTSATPETARPAPLLPPPPQWTECEDEEDEDLHDDPPPLNE